MPALWISGSPDCAIHYCLYQLREYDQEGATEMTILLAVLIVLIWLVFMKFYLDQQRGDKDG